MQRLAPFQRPLRRQQRHRYRKERHVRNRATVVVPQSHLAPGRLHARHSSSAPREHFYGRNGRPLRHASLETLWLDIRPGVLIPELHAVRRDAGRCRTARPKPEARNLKLPALGVRRVKAEADNIAGASPVGQIHDGRKRHCHHMPFAVAHERRQKPPPRI